MPELEIPVITNLDKKASDVDLPLNIARQCKNLSTTERPGSLSKFNFYTDVSDSLVSTLPDGHTLQNITEFPITSPEDKQIFLVHTKKSGADHLLMGPFFNPKNSLVGSSGADFSTAWIDLLEREELDIDSATDNSITATNLAEDTDDYYKLWFCRVFDINGTGVNVDAVILGNTGQALTFTTDALSGINGNETIVVSRCPFVLDSGDDGFPVVDDIIRFLKRESSMTLMTGNTSPYPTQIQGFLSFIHHRLTVVTSGNDVEIHRINLDMEQPPQPYLNDSPPSGYQDILTELISSASGISNLTAGTWEFAVAFEYDGFQIGPLSTVRTLAVSSGHVVQVALEIPYLKMRDSTDSNWIKLWNDAPSFYSQLIGDRPTAVYIFAKTPDSKVFRMVELGDYTPTSITKTPFTFKENYEKDANAEPQLSFHFNQGVFVFGTFDESTVVRILIYNDPTGVTYDELVGSSNIRPNYKYAVGTDNHVIAAALHSVGGTKQDNDLIGSSVSSVGVPNYNMYGGKNIINLGFYGTKKITGIAILGDIQTTQSPKARIAVFAEDTYWILQLTPGASFGHALDRPGQKEGLIAPNSLVAAEGFLFGLSRNGFRMFDVGGTQIIGEGLKPDIDALTTPEDCFAVYHKNARKVIFYFKADNKAYYIDMLSQGFGMFELTFNDTLNSLTPLNDGSFLSITDEKIFSHGTGNTQDGTPVTPLLRTGIVNSGKFSKIARNKVLHPHYGSIGYKSNTPIKMSVYLDRSVSPLSMSNVDFPVKHEFGIVDFGFPAGTTAKEVEFEVTLDSEYLSTNTSFVIEDLWLNATITKNFKR